MPTFLKQMDKKYCLYIATGTPEDEILEIVKVRELSQYFKGVYGTPSTKEQIIHRIMAENHYQPNELVFFGDAESDRISANKTGTHFIGRIGHGSQAMGETRYKIKDFSGIAEIENSMLRLIRSYRGKK